MKTVSSILSTALSIALLTSTFFTNNAFADDAAAGKQKAAMCASCHGQNGLSSSPIFPNLACQKASYLAKQLQDFKSGARNDPMMVSFAKSLSEDDIENLSTYYNQLPCSG